MATEAQTSTYQEPSRVTLLAVVIWGLSAVFYFYEFLLQASTSVMVPELMDSFSLKASEVGHLSAFYLYAYALMQLPAGMLIDKFGPRRLLTFATLCCATGAVLFSMADTYVLAKASRFMMGIGGGFAVVSCLKITTLWFPTRYFALMAGLMVTCGMLGVIFGQAPLAILIESVGWQQALNWGGLVGFGLAGIMWLVVRDAPEGFKESQVHNETIGMLKGLYLVSKNPQVWVASLFAGLMFVPTLGFGELWGVPYLVERLSIDRAGAGMICSLIFMGWVFGGPFFGWLSDAMGRRIRPLLISTLGTLLSLLVILYIPMHNPWLIGVGFFFLGVFSAGFVLAFSVVREISIPILSGTAIGFINVWNTIGGAAAQPLLGHLLDMQSKGVINEQGSPVFDLAAYESALVSLPVAIVIALCLLPFIKETFCKPMLQDK